MYHRSWSPRWWPQVTSHVTIPTHCWCAVMHQYMKWWPHLLWVNICSIRLLKSNWTKWMIFSLHLKEMGASSWSRPLFYLFLQKAILHPDEMKLLKNQLKKFPNGNWSKQKLLQLNWVNKKSLVSVAFNQDLSFVSFGLFDQPSIEGNEHALFCQLNKLPFQNILFLLKQLEGIHKAHLCRNLDPRIVRNDLSLGITDSD